MPNQRLVFIETGYGEGILFDQKDTVQAYQLLSRATKVKVRDRLVIPEDSDIDVKLIDPKRLMREEDFIPKPPSPELLEALKAPEQPCPF